MKRKVFKFIVAVTALTIFTGCGSKNPENGAEEKKVATDEVKNTNMYDNLNEQQRKYLTETQQLTEDAINEMDYEAINYNLLGTGFELYNPSSGVEVFGVEYKGEDELKECDDSAPVITVGQAVEISKKGKDMRLEDFSEYRYEIEELQSEKGKNAYKMQLPVSDYEDLFVNVVYSQDENGNIKMKAPFFVSKSEDEDYTFSILYDAGTLKAYYEKEPLKTIEGKAYLTVQYSSVTEKSLVISAYNWSDNKLKLKEDYEIYEIDGDNKTLLVSYDEGEEVDILPKTHGIYPVSIKDNVKLEPGKNYMIKYGKEADGYLSGEINFVR